MKLDVSLILDDRVPPPPEIVAAIGEIPFRRILRRRRRLAEEIAEMAAAAGRPLHVVDSDEAALALALRIESRGVGPVYLRLPACLAPIKMAALGPLITKAAFTMETMLISPILRDEAAAVLGAGDAVALLRARDAEARREVLLRIADSAPRMVDHLELVDLRRPRALLHFLSGATEARHFNETASGAGIFRKTSPEIAKMRAEYRFFHIAPEEMKRFLVPTFGFWETPSRAGYEMEHLPIPDAALQLIHRAFSAEDFEVLLDQFFAFLAARRPGPQDAAATLAAGRAHILDKLDARLESLMALPVGRKLDALLQISGPQAGLRAMQARARPLIEAALSRDAAKHLVVGHGDPCFSNILFDRRLGLLRLIDPRGAESLEEAMMHPLYDLAKFSHSVLGGYDFINNDLFSCDLGAGLDLTLELDDGGPPPWMQAAFRARLQALGYDVRVLRAVELSLFLSMLPLHADHPRKLIGFALVAARILSELETRA